MISEEQKKSAVGQFHSAIQLDGELQKVSLLKKIKKIQSLGDLREKIYRKIDSIKRHTSFAVNERIVSFFYGKHIETFFVFQTSPEDAEQINNLLSSSKELRIESLNQSDPQAKGKRGTRQVSIELYDRMNANQTWFEIKRNVIYDDFLHKIKPIIRNYLKSPFAVVNLNAWKTKPKMGIANDPNGNLRGPNRLHKDGMPAGHFKCLIYLRPLDDSHGKVQVEEEILESEKPGFSLLFNTEAYHQSIPGNAEDRYVLELTLMRTVVEVDMLKYYPGVPDSIHLLQAYQVYI
jgi:hypothetical protein